MKPPALLLAAFLGGCAGMPPPEPAELRVLSAIGMRQVVLAVAPDFERRTGHRIEASFDSGGRFEERLGRGERFDVVLAPRAVIDRLSTATHIVEGTDADIAASVAGVAVREGAPALDISSVDAFRQALLNARAIACPDPRMGGSSGVHIARVFERLGIADAIRPRLVLASTPDVPGTLPGDLLAAGRADLALHQMQELLAVEGIRVAGPLPPELQARFVFTFGIMQGATNSSGAEAFLRFLRSADGSVTIRDVGMEPIVP